MIFDKYFYKREKILKRRIELDVTLYERLKELSEIYEASINKLINVSIIEMLEANNVNLYDRKVGELSETHNFNIREDAYRGLKELKNKHHLTINKLVNIAIYNAVNSK